jgi:hypothetical protein
VRVRAQEEGVCLIITTQSLSFTSPSPPIRPAISFSHQHSPAQHTEEQSSSNHTRTARGPHHTLLGRVTSCSISHSTSHVTRHTYRCHLSLLPLPLLLIKGESLCVWGLAGRLIYSSPPSSSAGAFAASSSSTVGSMASSGSAASSATGGGRGGEKDAPSKLAPLPTYTLAQ